MTNKRAFVIYVGTIILLLAVFGNVIPTPTRDRDDDLGKYAPDERACIREMRHKYVSMTEEQIAALPGSYQDAFAIDMLSCVGRKQLVREKMQKDVND